MVGKVQWLQPMAKTNHKFHDHANECIFFFFQALTTYQAEKNPVMGTSFYS